MCSVGIETTNGRIVIVSLYIPPNNRIDIDIWNRLFIQLSQFSHVIITGDFNAHSPLWGHSTYNHNGSNLTALSDFDFTVLNDDTPTYCNIHSGYSSVLDLVIALPSLVNNLDVNVLNDTFFSDHYPLISTLSFKPKYSISNSTRYNLSKLNWELFHSKMNLFAVDALNDIDNESILPDVLTYTRMIEKIKESILDSGGFKPSNRGQKPGKSKPVWWNDECSSAVERRSTARKVYFRNQTQEALIQYLQINNEVKNFLSNQKRNSYKQFCSINPSMGLKKIWNIIKGFQTANSAKSTNIYNNPNLPEIVSIQEEILNSNIP